MNEYIKKTVEFTLIRDPENGCVIGPDGCHHESEQEAMYFGQLGLCGCGSPEDVHQFLLDCLTAKRDDAESIIDYKKVEQLVAERPAVVADLVLHFLDSKCLTEHGGSVFGSWLTDRGKQFVRVGVMKGGEQC